MFIDTEPDRDPPSVRRAMFIDAEPDRDPPSVRRAMFTDAEPDRDPPSVRRAMFIDASATPIRPPSGGQCLGFGNSPHSQPVQASCKEKFHE